MPTYDNRITIVPKGVTPAVTKVPKPYKSNILKEDEVKILMEDGVEILKEAYGSENI